MSATDGTNTGAGTFGLTAKNAVIMASIENQTDPVADDDQALAGLGG